MRGRIIVEKLCDNALLEVYKLSLEKDLDKDFIELLRNELKKRNLPMSNLISLRKVC